MNNRELCEEYHNWADQEGGWVSLVFRNGAASFPEPLTAYAYQLERAVDEMSDAAHKWAADTGANTP